jgi:hypothetical protein
LCGNAQAWFRSRDTGAFVISTHELTPTGVKDDASLDERQISDQVAAAGPFLAKLNVPQSCIVFTVAPYNETPVAAANAISKALRIPLVMPRLDGLTTLDGSHLNSESAQRWSADFLRLAGPLFKRCLDATEVSK